jgi:hypothetical protein
MSGSGRAIRSNARTGWSAPSHPQSLLTDRSFPAAILSIQEDKISSLRRRGCHGKRFDTFVTPYLAGRAQRYFVLVRISVVQYELALYLTPPVRLNAILYWRADFKLNLQRYSVLDSELLDTRWNSSAIRDTGFTIGNCTRSP